jgi:Flp pilus assembly protein TadG
MGADTIPRRRGATKPMRAWRKRGRRGEALIEMGLCMMVLLVLIFGMFQFSQVAFANNFCAFAAQQGARYASLRGSSSINALPTSQTPCGTSCTNEASGDPLTAYIKTLAVGLNPSNLTVATTWTSSTGNGNAAGGTVTVTVTYPYTMSYISPVGVGAAPATWNLHGSATMEVLQ